MRVAIPLFAASLAMAAIACSTAQPQPFSVIPEPAEVSLAWGGV